MGNDPFSKTRALKNEKKHKRSWDWKNNLKRKKIGGVRQTYLIMTSLVEAVFFHLNHHWNLHLVFFSPPQHFPGAGMTDAQMESFIWDLVSWTVSKIREKKKRRDFFAHQMFLERTFFSFRYGKLRGEWTHVHNPVCNLQKIVTI